MKIVALAVALSLAPWTADAQISDTLQVDLDAIQVTAARVMTTAAEAPLAVAVEARDPMERTTEPGESLEGVLRHLPGLWVSDRENFALGERVSVRGMGARAGFGVRGIQVVLDGIPLTLPDGQTSLVIADPAMIRRAELIRGPASTLWGNAGGGVLFLETIPDNDVVEARLAGGSFGMMRADADAAHTFGAHRGGVAISHLRREGYRDHSAYEVTRGRVFGRIGLGGDAILTTTAAFEWAPRQQHPGALTAEQLAEDPRQAQPAFVAQHAGKDSKQGQVGAAVTAPTRVGTISASGFAMARTLENPLPFAYIDLDRLAGGARLALDREDGPVRWSAGVDAGVQRDDRRNWANQTGVRGERRLDQLETVVGVAAFAQTLLRFESLSVSLGARYDLTHFRADDRLAAGGGATGSRALDALSPSVGISYRLGSAVLFASAGTAFETPTTTELVNRPDGGAGFNPDLFPQRTRGLEVGVRGTDRAGRLYYDVAVFRLAIRDQLTQFEGDDGRTYYRNAEATTHDGVEAFTEWRAAEWLRLGASYSWSRFVFDDAAGNLAGNRLPGVPEHRLSARARITTGSLFGSVSALVAGATFADDANTARADGYAVLDLRLGYTNAEFAAARVIPFLQIRNLFDVRYSGSVALNAAGGRYFEPAAGRSLQVGVSLRANP